jgi:pimeloyl-ACP methyl ester carboxylesterase
MEYVLKGDHGPIMLFLHGAPGGYDAAPDAGENFRLLAPSRPGYLSTPLETGRTPAEQARAYAALLDALEIREPVLVMAPSGGGAYSGRI